MNRIFVQLHHNVVEIIVQKVRPVILSLKCFDLILGIQEHILDVPEPLIFLKSDISKTINTMKGIR
jgi:hypothetical protein